ncbi:hypothetical protein ACOSQB_02340 [Tenacibaculum sp. MEBiC07804]
MKVLKFIGVLFFVINTYSQESFYEQLRKNGQEATYVTFYRRTNPMTEIFKPGNKGEEVKIKIIEVNEIPIGFDVFSIKTGKRLFGFNEVENYGRPDHYPLVKMMKHKYDSEAYAMIDGSMYKFNVGKDKKLKAQNIWQAFVLKKSQVKTDKKVKKKKGFFNKFKKFKVGRIGVEKEYLYKIDLKVLVANYDKTMSSKQRVYKLSGKDKSEIAKIESFRKNRKNYVKRYNDSVYKTPEYQKMLAHQKRMSKMDEQNSKRIVTITNNTGKSIYIFEEGSRNGSSLGNTNSRSFPCNKNGYYSTVPNSSINGNGRLFYRANSGCSSKVSIK